jgi:hypothetical protein
MDRRKLLALGMALPGGLQGQAEETIEVDTHRPLAAMADLLEARFGIAVNYEDPPYVSLEDVEDVATAEQTASSPGFRLLVPRKGRVRVGLPDKKGVDGLEEALREAVASYEAAKLPGRFQVEKLADSFTISPVGGSVLDFRPTLAPGNRPLIEHLAEIFGQANGVKIAAGSGPFLPPYPAWFGVSGVTARVAVGQLMAKVGSRRWSYRLLYDYKWRGYMMNLKTVAA